MKTLTQSNTMPPEKVPSYVMGSSGDTRDYTKDPVYIMDILELYAFKERMDSLNAAKALIWLGAK